MKRKPVVCFITLSHGDWGGASRVLFTNLGLIDRERLEPLLLLPRHGPIESELAQRELSYEIWGSLTEPGNPVKYLYSLLRMLAFLRRRRVDVIHINGASFWRPAELLAAKLLGVPVIIHYHVINSQPGPFVSLCSAAICVSRYTAEQSLPPSLPKPVIYNSISLERFDRGTSMRSALGLDEDNIVVAFLGQIREIKGVADFMTMARRIEAPNARFLIAGECRDPVRFPGSYAEADLARMAGGDDRIRYIGYVKQVEDVYHTADIVVVPSRWQEPLGLINLEAGACRRPVVATRVGGIPEIIHDGENGFLVAPGDVDALTAGVRRLVDDAALRERLGHRGRQLVEERFSLQPIREFENLLVGLANGTRLNVLP